MYFYIGLFFGMSMLIIFACVVIVSHFSKMRAIRNRERILMHMNWLSNLGLYETSFLMYKTNRPYVLSKETRSEWFGLENSE